MDNKEIFKNAFWQAAATTGYISLVASFFFTAHDLLGWVKEPSISIPIFMLSLFVFSAAMTGSLVVGQPLLWYIDGRRREAVILFVSTLIFFFLFTIITSAGLYFIS